jgi:curli biogenesis system outer membrane secretion channel CsgG
MSLCIPDGCAAAMTALLAFRRRCLVIRATLSGLMTIVVLATGCSTNVASRNSGTTIDRAQTEPVDGPKKRIAVMPFDVKVQRGGQIGSGMSDMLADALVNTNRFIVLERQHVKDVMAEQDFGRSGRVKKETAPAVGEIEGAQLLIRGAVTTFEPECSGGTLAVVGLKKACVSVNMRIIDAKTGRVLNATTVDGSAMTAGVGLTANVSTMPLPLGLGGWSKTPMERAIRDCIDSAVQHIVKTNL